MRAYKALIALVFLMGIFLTSACSRFDLVDRQTGNGVFSGTPAAGDVAAAPAGAGYMDFQDVIIPPELKRSNSDCYLMNGAGRLVLSGRVEGESLAKFFLGSMPGSGWQLIQEYKYQGNIRHFYTKPDKVATILIAENPLDTRVEIWVTPLTPANAAVAVPGEVQPPAALKNNSEDTEAMPMALPMQQ